MLPFKLIKSSESLIRPVKPILLKEISQRLSYGTIPLNEFLAISNNQ